jgi:alpha-1,6-mannosyltransferase
MPNGSEYQPFQIVQAAVMTILTIVVLYLLTRNRLPWPTRIGPPAPERHTDEYAESS